jgi:hypothetical protein
MGNMAMGYGEMQDAGGIAGVDASMGFTGVTDASPSGLRAAFTIDDIAHPAYMLSLNFELSWCNDRACETIFGLESSASGFKSRNLFDILGTPGDERKAALLQLAANFWARIYPEERLKRICETFPVTTAALLKQPSGTGSRKTGLAPVEIPFAMQDGEGRAVSQRVYGFYFREGVLVVHVPEQIIDPSLLDIIAGRESVARSLMRRQAPVLKTISVLDAQLDAFAHVRALLKPEEYLQLIAETWARMTPIFRKHFGTYGTHNGDGVRYYFLPRLDSEHAENAAACAVELECEMRKISGEWQKRNKLARELKIQLNIRHGEEWLGPGQSEARLEFAARINQSNSRARFNAPASHPRDISARKWAIQLEEFRSPEQPGAMRLGKDFDFAGRKMPGEKDADGRPLKRAGRKVRAKSIIVAPSQFVQ